jgi:hypothetical protein
VIAIVSLRFRDAGRPYIAALHVGTHATFFAELMCVISYRQMLGFYAI